MNLDSVFYPQSIAIVGASTKPGSVGNDLVKNLVEQGYEGKIYPVNPKTDRLFNLPCYPNLTAIGQKVELALIAIPAAGVPAILEECGSLKIRGAIVISAGFKEIGNTELEDQLLSICHKHDIALIGPNCLGVINPEIQMNASFAMVMPHAGSVAFISQSGALCTAVLDRANKMGIGFSKFVSVGNKAVINELSLFKYLQSDPKTKVIVLYVEQLAEAQKLIAAAKAITQSKENPKPILVLKAGKTAAGASASASHTGALAGNDAAYDALFRQSGIQRIDGTAELFDRVQAFSNNDLPKGRRVAIITNAGGPGVLTTDAVIEQGLTLAQLDVKTIEGLKAVLPSAAATHNPVDVLGDARADRYKVALKLVSEDPNVDNLMVILTPQSMTEFEATAQAIVEAHNESEKPFMVSFMGDSTVKAGVRILRVGGIASFAYPEKAIASLRVLCDFREWSLGNEEIVPVFKDVDKKAVVEIFDNAKKQGKTLFPEADALEILSAYKFPLLQRHLVKSAKEAMKIGKLIGKPLALKIESQDILHKTDAGGISLNVKPAEAGEAYEDMMKRITAKFPKAKIDGVLLMEMAPLGGLELILGANRDPQFGPLLMYGFGGIYVEALKDVTFGLAPLTSHDAKTMMGNVRCKALYAGIRGGAPLDQEKVLEMLGRLSQLVTDFPQIREIDINPLLMYPRGQGVRVLDARIVID